MQYAQQHPPPLTSGTTTELHSHCSAPVCSPTADTLHASRSSNTPNKSLPSPPFSRHSSNRHSHTTLSPSLLRSSDFSNLLEDAHKEQEPQKGQLSNFVSPRPLSISRTSTRTRAVVRFAPGPGGVRGLWLD